MSIVEFKVCRNGSDAQWTVRKDDALYGDYLDGEQARLDAVEAAQDALQTGHEAQVWIREGESYDRLF